MFKALFSSTALFAIPLFAMVASSAMAAPPQHNCNGVGGAEKLQDKIDDASEGDVLEVKGNCTGVNYVIATDRLTLRGIDGATITGAGGAAAVAITSNQVTIEGWALIDGGADHGIVVRASGSALVRDILQISGHDGVQAIEAAFVEINNTNINGASEDGISAITNGSALLIDSDISGNGRFGVLAASGGSANIAGGNTINDNGNTGVFASGGQVLVNGANTVQDNANDDIACFTFARIIVFQSIASTSNKLRKLDCALIEASGVPVFETHPQNLVDCAAGDTIAEAISNGATFITVRGLCNEHLNITTSNIMIIGETLDGTGNPVDGINTDLGPGIGTFAVAVVGAQNVHLINLAITGGRNGVLINRSASVFITNDDIAPFAAAGGGRYGLFVGDNAFLSMVDSSVSAGSLGGILALRDGNMRIFNSDISGGATNKFALTMNESVAYLYGVDFVGAIGAHFNSRVGVFNAFLGNFYGNTVIDSTIGPGQCSRYSNINSVPADIVRNTSGTAFDNADFFSFLDCHVTIE